MKSCLVICFSFIIFYLALTQSSLEAISSIDNLNPQYPSGYYSKDLGASVAATTIKGQPYIPGTDQEIYVIMVEFSSVNSDEFGLIDGVTFDNIDTAKEVAGDRIWNDPTLSMKNYYDEDSYGKLQILGDNSHILATVTVPYCKDYYGYNSQSIVDIGWMNDDGGVNWPPEQEKAHSYRLVIDAVTAADDAIDFSIFDEDNDGHQDENKHLIVVYAGGGEKRTQYEEANSQAPWPVFWDLGTGDEGVIADDVQMEKGIILSIECTLGAYVHEFGHSIGAPDVYDLDDGSSTTWDSDNKPVYSWGLMANGEWGARPGETAGTCPTHHIGYNKWQYGWVKPIVITPEMSPEQRTVTIKAIEKYDQDCLYKILIANHGDKEEYFLLENRHPGAGGTYFDTWSSHRIKVTITQDGVPIDTVDTYYPLDSGILITHVDERGIDTSIPGVRGRYNSSYNDVYTLWVEDPTMVTGGYNQVQIDNVWNEEYEVGIPYYTGNVDEGLYGLYKLGAAYSMEDGQVYFTDGIMPDVGDDVLWANSKNNDGNSSGVFIRILDESDEEMRVEIGFNNQNDDITNPELTTSILQNYAFPQQIDIYVIPNEYLQSLNITVNNSEISVVEDNGVFLGEYTMSGNGSYQVSIEAMDEAGNITNKGVDFSANQIRSNDNGQVYSFDQEANLTVMANSFDRPETYIICQKTDQGYQFSSTFTNLNNPAKLSFDIKDIEFDKNLGIYQLTDTGWKYIKTQYAPSSNSVFADVEQLGIYALKLGNHENILAAPQQVAVYQNYPNPFNPSTIIQFELPNRDFTSLKIYDSAGKLVKILANDFMESGYHSCTWNGQNENGDPAASGIYYYQLKSDAYQKTRAMLLVK